MPAVDSCLWEGIHFLESDVGRLPIPHACTQWAAPIGHSGPQDQVSAGGWKAEVLKGPKGSCMKENEGMIR